jgi:hypothetical protein
MAALIKGAGELFPEALVVYVTTFPRHVEKCCDKQGHMTESDVLTTDSVRREVDRDVKEVVMEGGRNIRILEWWDLLGLDGDTTVTNIRRMGIIDTDGVHLTTRACRNAALILCDRLNGMERDGDGDEEVEGAGWMRERKRTRT